MPVTGRFCCLGVTSVLCMSYVLSTSLFARLNGSGNIPVWAADSPRLFTRQCFGLPTIRRPVIHSVAISIYGGRRTRPRHDTACLVKIRFDVCTNPAFFLDRHGATVPFGSSILFIARFRIPWVL